MPEPGPGEVLVEVHAAAVNPLDLVNAAGLLGTPLPVIPGGDFAGVVVSGGGLAGQEVWGSAPSGMALGMKRPGTHAGRGPARDVAVSQARAPDDDRSRRCRPTVFRGLEDGDQRHGAQPGETILITGGAGMVGQAATAIARWRGADADHRRPRKPEGVEHFIDTSSGDTPRRCSSSPTGAAPTWRWTRSAARCSNPPASLRFGCRLDWISTPTSSVRHDLVEIYSYETATSPDSPASSWTEPTAPTSSTNYAALFDRGRVDPLPAIRTWSLENSAEAYQTVHDGSGGVKQVLLPTLLSPADSAGQGVAQHAFAGAS